MDTRDFRYFDIVDYVVFGGLLALSAFIGVYFAFFAKQKQNTTMEYLMGGKNMGIFPISMSLVASYTSGITLLGYPAEMYKFGTQFWVAIFAELVTSMVMAWVYIPVFYKLQITSSYEYLNRRFSPAVRTMGSALFLLKMMLYIPIVIYVPALAFSQVSGFTLEAVIPVVCIVCIFYTTLGGIKAVVWTDTLQMMLMLLGIITVAVMGTIDVGGVKNVYERNHRSDRLEFLNTSWDPTIRHTLWNVLLGRFFFHMAESTINQAMVQRCLSVSTLKKARYTIGIFAFGIFWLVNLCNYTGLVIYAAFHDCDPVTSGSINKMDQILPYFVMKVTSHVPALPGIFVSGVFSAALSTMSTGLNSMCGVILEDFIRPNVKKPISEGRASFIMKVITVVLGCLCVMLSFIVDKLAGIIQASGSLAGITGGTLLGMFTLGMLFPWANAQGAIVGGLAAALLVGWMSVGSQMALHSKAIVFPTKPVSLEGCDNATMAHYWAMQSNITEISEELDAPFPLYTVSYMYFTVIGVVTVIVVGMAVSWMTGFNDPDDMDPDVFSPVIHRFLSTKRNARPANPKDEGTATFQTKPLLETPPSR